MLNRDGTLREYANYTELFVENPERFGKNIEKAWFLLGRLYNQTEYSSKKYYDKDESALSKNLMLNDKFDEKFFIKLATILENKLKGYEKLTGYVKNIVSDMAQYEAQKEEELDIFEAKYLFFWGYSQWFKGEKKIQTDDIEIEESEKQNKNNQEDSRGYDKY